MEVTNSNNNTGIASQVPVRVRDTRKKNVAVILAGGSGTRVGGDCPKQFLEIAGKTIIEHTIEAFASNPRIDEIAVVTRHDYTLYVHDLLAVRPCTKVRHVVAGGKERYYSTLAALSLYTDDDTRLLIHDAVRPLVTQRIIDDCLDALDECDAVNVAIPATDTIIQVDGEGRMVAVPPRATLRNVQTPQGFRRAVLRKAFDLALQDEAFVPTDDCSVVFRYMPDTQIKVIAGDVMNIKITYPDDLREAERVLNERAR